MPQPQFRALKERLLHAGIAPKHVRRYVAELEDHFDDLVHEETTRGLDKSTAENAALNRLGDDETLAQTMLDRPELKSLTARYPWAVFGIAPPVLLAVAVYLGILANAGLFSVVGAAPAVGADMPDWIKAAVAAWHGLLMYAAPLAVAVAVGIIGLRQRTEIAWLILGASIVVMLGSFLEIGMVWSELPGQSSLSVGLHVSGKNALIGGLVRLPINLLVLAGFYWLWRRRESAHEQ